MVELAQLFQDLNEIVVQQEPLVENIEQKGEEVRDNVVKANEEIAVAIDSARARNRKKWYCLGLVSKCIFPTNPHLCFASTPLFCTVDLPGTIVADHATQSSSSSSLLSSSPSSSS